MAEKHEGDRQQEAETKRAELDSQLQESMVKEANMTSAAQQAAAEVSLLEWTITADPDHVG